ncbi:MAG: hypothetical protein AB2L11_10090 [Syntrophobacteraceae bacterium]
MFLKSLQYCAVVVFLLLAIPYTSSAWNSETHLAVAKAAGYSKWYNAAGADMAKLKAGKVEESNHYVANPPGATVTAKTVLDQVGRYNQEDAEGHLYGAIVASVRSYMEEREKGKYGEFHLGFCAHYVGDLSMPLHNTHRSISALEHHAKIDGIVEEEVLDNLVRIKVYPVQIRSEEDLAKEIARVANISLELEAKIESENRFPRKEEVYIQLGHSASLLKAILEYVK